MAVKDKVQCPVRMYKDQYNKMREKASEDGMTFQKLSEILFNAYLKDNKGIRKLVEKYADSKHSRKKRPVLDNLESEELLRIIEQEHTPLRDLEKLIKEELDDEQSNSYSNGF